MKSLEKKMTLTIILLFGWSKFYKKMKNKKNDSIYTTKSEAGKGDQPRNIGKKYWDNFDKIDWGKKLKNKKIK